MLENREQDRKNEGDDICIETDSPKRKANLLIVDDHLDSVRTLSIILSSHGFRVRKAISAQMALEAVEAEPPDLILLDIKMPDVDGYTFCATLKAESQTKDIPIIFLSVLDKALHKVKAFESGAVDYITKPFQPKEVLARISHQLIIQKQRKQLKQHNQRLKQEIRERRQAEAETKLLLTTIQAVSQASNFNDAVYSVLCEVRRGITWDYGEAWILSKDGTTLELCRTCYDSDDSLLNDFHNTTSELTFARDVEFLGEIWKSLQPIWIENLTQQETLSFLRTEAAIAAGLKTAFGIPILKKEEVLAVLVFFKRGQMPYESKLVKLVNAIALQLGELMQRLQVEDELRRANLELQRLANLDGLTQLANRRCFDESLNQEWQRLQREHACLALILCDIDYFKQYNDYYGHQAGDICLKKVAVVLVYNSRRSTDLVARYGGEEFVILLPHTEVDGAIYVAQQIQKEIANLGISHDNSVVNKYVTLSIGIACVVPSPESSPDNLVAAADRALYTAKAQGRNTYCVSYDN
jgi:two-component system cell cycle response regulator